MGKNNAKAAFSAQQQPATNQEVNEAAASEEVSQQAADENEGSDVGDVDPAGGAGDVNETDPSVTSQASQESSGEPVTALDEDILIAPTTAVKPVATVSEEKPEVKEVTPVATASKGITINSAVVVESTTPAAVNTLKDQLQGILKNVPPAYQVDLGRVFTYLERMAPNRPITNADGAKEQVALYKVIQNIINRQEEHFTPLFSALLAIFKAESNGVLSDYNRLRFRESMVLGEGDRKAFVNLTHLLFVTADPKSRGNIVKMVNLDRTLENGLTAAGRDRVLNFYNA